MITQTQETKEYIEPVIGIKQSQPSFSPDSKNELPSVGSFGHKFKHRFISEQMKITKRRLAEAQTPQTLIQLGDLYLLRDNYKRAIMYFMMALDLKPNFLPAYEKILFACLSHKNHIEANEVFSKILTITNRRPDILHKYAIFKALIDQFDPDVEEALSVLDEVAKASPTDHEAINTHGLILLNLKNDITGSRTYFETSHKINPNYVHSINNLGVTYLREEKYDQAVRFFEQAIEVDPAYPLSYQNLACLFDIQEKYTEGLDVLTKAKHKQINLDRAWEHKVGWFLLRLNRFDEAIAWYKRKIQEEPKNDLLYNNLGVCYKSIGANPDADWCFEKSVSLFKKRLLVMNPLAINADHLKSSYNVGRSAISKGDFDKLFEISKFILEINPEDAFGLYLKGAYLGRTDQYQNAKELFERALKIDETVAEIYPDYAFILSAIEGEYTSAINILKRAMELGFDSVLIQNNLAHAYALNGEVKSAEDILKKFDEKNTPPVLYATKGLLEFRKKNQKAGNQFYQKAIDSFGSSKNIQIASQIWRYEKALFAFNNGDFDQARTEIVEAKRYPESYVNKDISKLLNKIEAVNLAKTE